MHADTPTKLSLWDFAQVLGINPLHFAGIQIPNVQQSAICNLPWLQYDWQEGDRVGRDAVAVAIDQAEQAMEEYLGFRLLPTYEVGERHSSGMPYHPEMVNYNGRRVGGWSITEKSRWGWVVEGGTRALTALTVTPVAMNDITWSNSGYWKIGTVLVDLTGTVITDPEEVRVFYPGHSGEETWEIRPTTVSISGNTATVSFKRECAVDESLWQQLEPMIADGTDDADFLTTVDAYRVYSDPSGEALLLYEPIPDCRDCGNADGGCPRCQFQSQTGCFVVSGDPRYGNLSWVPGTWDATTKSFTTADLLQYRNPDMIELSYLAGYQDKASGQPRRQMARKWRNAVAYFAASLLERPPCDCAPDNWEYWREDLSTSNPGSTAAGGTITRVDRKDLINPFGTRRGAIWAWKRVLAGEALAEPVLFR